jgi:hypothetical protein
LKKPIILLFISIIIIINIFPQAKAATVIISEVPQWEYMVVSFGKTYFEFPEKSSKYISLLDSIGKEGLTLQKNLDILGKYGWELLLIVGTIGGDQQLVLKRKYDSSTIKRDEEAIKKINEKIKMEIEQKEKMEAEQKKKVELNLAQKNVLVNMDEIDEQNEMEKINKEVGSYIKLIIDEIKDEAIIKKYIIDNSYQYEVHIDYDLTASHLSNVNEYRKSLVEEYLDEKLEEISIDVNKIAYKEILIIISGYIKFGKDNIEVGKKQKTIKYSYER